MYEEMSLEKLKAYVKQGGSKLQVALLAKFYWGFRNYAFTLKRSDCDELEGIKRLELMRGYIGAIRELLVYSDVPFEYWGYIEKKVMG